MNKKKYAPDEIKFILAKLNWIDILNDAMTSRKTSWGQDVVREWRNAGDTVYGAVVRALTDAGMFPTLEEELADFHYRMKVADSLKWSHFLPYPLGSWLLQLVLWYKGILHHDQRKG